MILMTKFLNKKKLLINQNKYHTNLYATMLTIDHL